ncbi:MAG: RHS repeat-associated core domain-containing protein [Devosia sp.]|jgi:RHS repeat-associated protein|nr:RHS repeat-associated core domain-containing protein [Devosia sp.]
MALTDAGGNFVNETDYVVFGNTWSVAGAVGVDLRFPGQMAQYESGLFYNWNRQYDPTIARYTQPDPLGLVDGPSRYAYVGNGPLQKVDPSGEFAFVIPAIPAIVSGIAGAVTGAIAGAIIRPAIIPEGSAEAGRAAGICAPTGGDDKEHCYRQNEIDEDQCYKNYNYSLVDLSGCLQRASDNLNLCLRGFPGVPTWKDGDVDGWQPPKHPKS